jgi:predicted cobalt transporter CbtA
MNIIKRAMVLEVDSEFLEELQSAVHFAANQAQEAVAAHTEEDTSWKKKDDIDRAAKFDRVRSAVQYL